MPSKKIYIVLILCIGIVVSIGLLSRKPDAESINKTDETSVSIINDAKTQNSIKTDWQSILTSLDATNQKVNNVSQDSNAEKFDNTTLTAQMAKDFFSQYLSIAKKGEVSEEDATIIANNVLSSPEYTQNSGAVYISSNLHINQKTDKATIEQYLNSLNQMIKNRGVNDNDDDPMSIVAKAIKESSEKELQSIDPLITKIKHVISDLLVISVPPDAVKVHLGLLNTSSNLLSSLETMRAIFDDPVRGFVGASLYVERVSDFQNAIKNIRAYFEEKL